MKKWLYEVLSEEYCNPEIFWENIECDEEVKKNLMKAKTKEEVRKIVNNYI